MMTCAVYRRSLLADPRHPDEVMLEHVAACDECRGYTERVLHFESRLDLAVHVRAERFGESSAQPRIERRARPSRVRAWAIAASVLASVLVAGGLWLGGAGSSLAADVVGHMAGEPDAWLRTDTPVSSQHLDEVLNLAHVRLKSDAGRVSYASSCEFRGHVVPHLVVQTAGGPVTVMILTHEFLPAAVNFQEQGYRGILVPLAGHGSLAVLDKSPQGEIAIDAVVGRVKSSIEWQ